MPDSTPPDRPEVTSAGGINRALRIFSSERAQKTQMRLYAALLFLTGILLTFNDKVFEFLSNFTDRPEILPGTLLIPYVYLIFQMVLSHLDRDEEAELEEVRYEERRRELTERILERRSAISSFERGMASSPKIDVDHSTIQVAGWVGERATSKHIELLMLAYSSETFLSGCLASAKEIQKALLSAGDATPPQKVELKLLIRDLHTQWKLPLLQEVRADANYRTKLKGRFSQFLSRWDEELPEAFGDVIYRHQLDIEIRCYPFEPFLKGAVVNREVGLVGMYGIHSVKEGGVEGWDYHGWGATMQKLSALPDASDVERNALQDFVAYFDEIWTKHSRVLDL